MRSVCSLLVVALAWCLWAPAALAVSAAVDAQARFVANVDEAQAHLRISRELYAAGYTAKAALHSSHPVQELGRRVYGPIKRADPALGERVRLLLKKPRQAIDARVPPPRYAALLAEIDEVLEGAVGRVVPKDTLDTPSFQARVIGRLLDAVVEEYDEAWKAGRIAQDVEYHDAWGFFHQAQARAAKLPPGVAKAVRADFEALGKAFAEVTPPAKPLPLDRVKALVQKISTALASVAAT
jgi:hypothetical protein